MQGPEDPEVNNINVLELLIQHMLECDIGYAGFNFPIDFCEKCNYSGVINEDSCPSCGSKDIKRIRRITGYLSDVTNFNSAKRAELKDRVVHFND